MESKTNFSFNNEAFGMLLGDDLGKRDYMVIVDVCLDRDLFKSVQLCLTDVFEITGTLRKRHVQTFFRSPNTWSF